MSYSVVTTKPFGKQAKRLVKKYPSLKGEIAKLIESLQEEPFQGNSIGNDCYKIRLSIKSKGKGKSGGARVISHVQVQGTTVNLIAIYDKSEISTIKDNQVLELLKYL